MGAAGARLDGFVAAVGTAGTLMGVGRVVRGTNPAAAVARVVVAGETVDAEQGGPACLGIPGVVDCMSGLLDEDELGGHPPLAVPRTEAMQAALELARRGFPVGPSSGLNLAGARRLALTMGPGTTWRPWPATGWSATSPPTCSTTCGRPDQAPAGRHRPGTAPPRR